MDTARARLALDLLMQYDGIVPHLKALGAHQRGEIVLTAADIESHRREATQWFNRLYNLFHCGLIDVAFFQAVTSPAIARMWVERVAGLDAAIRKARGEKEDAPMNSVEYFWREYAAGRLHVPRRRRWQYRIIDWLLGRS